jgi:hypothetical protein
MTIGQPAVAGRDRPENPAQRGFLPPNRPPFPGKWCGIAPENVGAVAAPNAPSPANLRAAPAHHSAPPPGLQPNRSGRDRPAPITGSPPGRLDPATVARPVRHAPDVQIFHSSVENQPVLVDGTPKPMLSPAMLMTTSSRCHLSPGRGALTNAVGEFLPEFGAPLPGRLVRYRDATGG